MIRRTTLSADADDLATLEAEARREGVSLNHVLREIVAQRASEIRAARRPRLGLARSGTGAAAAAAADEHAPARGRLTS